MNTVKKEIDNQNGFVVIKCKKRINKRLDRFIGIVLIMMGFLCGVIEKDLCALLLMSIISIPLLFGKKRYVEI